MQCIVGGKFPLAMPLKMYDGSNVMYECCILIIDPVGLFWASFEYSAGTLFEVFSCPEQLNR